jgi:hypothetical protein
MKGTSLCSTRTAILVLVAIEVLVLAGCRCWGC